MARDYSWESANCLDLLQFVSKVAPDELCLTRFDFVKNKSLHLLGQAAQTDNIQILVDSLRNCQGIGKVKTEKPSKRIDPRTREEFHHFTIRCDLETED